ncbi:MAG TPA: hypothetical protein VFK41_01575 [Nocardioidaceae bacterium]|nr:hypothetical protein [Nocardioidaceae bacterium]
MFGRHQSTATDERTTTDTGRVPSPRHVDETELAEERADVRRERFGGTNWGAAVLGWMVAIAMTVLLAGIVGALAAAVGNESNVTTDQLADNAGTTGIAAAVVVVLILGIAYYTGGYVAGRMSRFDGARQGMAVWIVGLVVTLVAAALGYAFGEEYDVLDRVDLPSLSVPWEDLGTGGLITAASVLVVTLLAAVAGSAVGHRYHHKVDRAV